MDYDVIVVGGGGAGLAAALTAGERGARTLLVEAAPRLGGSTALSGGTVYAAGTSVQRSIGIEDTAEAMYGYCMALNRYRLHPGTILRLCEESAPALEWLIALGVEFPGDRLYVAGVDTVPRGHRAAGQGAGIVEVLDRHVSAHDRIDVAVATRVQKLLVQDGAVRGIRADGADVAAPSVVLTTGGFGANREMIAAYLPQTARYGDWLWYVGSPHCKGDGIAMGLAAGAEITGFDCVLPLLTPGFDRDVEPHIPGWFVFVDREGGRFADESLDYSLSGGLVRALPGGECFAIFDETARLGREVRTDKGGFVYDNPSWRADVLAHHAQTGRIAAAGSLEALAAAVGIPPARLAVTIAEYNEDCALGHDRAFLKSPDLLRPVGDPPFYAVRVRPAVVGITGTGLRIDREGCVIAATGLRIPGLFAAGEVAGGIMGEAYVGSGASLLNSFAFGRISGRAAAARAMH